MSKIEITVGNSTVEVTATAESETIRGTFPHYQERDLLDATAAALLAVNTPRAVAYAHAIFRLTKDDQ